MDRIKRLAELGQTLWLESIDSEEDLTEDAISRFLALGFAGVADCTVLSPAAVRQDERYEQAILDITASERMIDAGGIHEHLLLQDLAYVADSLHPEYMESRHTRGFAALLLIPHMYESASEIRECAHRLVRRLNRPNIVVKMPSSALSPEAVTGLVADNISVYVTGILDRERFAQVQEAYLAGLEHRAARHRPLDQIHCLAGLSIAGIDNMIDRLLNEALGQEESPEARIEIEGLKGRAGIATARLVANLAANRIRGPKWNSLQHLGAHPLTLVWEDLCTTQACTAQTYFNSLIGSNTICVLPYQQFLALTDQVVPSRSLFQGFSQANTLFADITRKGLELQREMDAEDTLRLEAHHEHYLGLLEVISEKRVAAPLGT